MQKVTSMLGNHTVIGQFRIFKIKFPSFQLCYLLDSQQPLLRKQTFLWGYGLQSYQKNISTKFPYLTNFLLYLPQLGNLTPIMIDILMLILQPLFILIEHLRPNIHQNEASADRPKKQTLPSGNCLQQIPFSYNLYQGHRLLCLNSSNNQYLIKQIIIKDMYQGSQGHEHGEGHHEHQTEQQGYGHGTVDLLTKLNSALSLAKAMPPSKLKKNLIGLIKLAPQIQDNLLQKIQLQMQIESPQSYPYLKTEFNRDGNSYRNPHTNHYEPENPQGYCPSGRYRVLQQQGGVLFAEYVKQYYGGNTVGNFYVMESDQGTGKFSCGFFAKKGVEEGNQLLGNWDSFNIVDVNFDGNAYQYKLNSTILIEMDINNNGINITGFLKKSKQEKKSYNKNISQAELFEHHLVTIGQMIEQMQTVMRQQLEAIYVAKTKQIIFTTRYENTIGMEKHRMNLANDLKKLRFGQ